MSGERPQTPPQAEPSAMSAPPCLRAVLEKVRDLLAAEAWDRTRRLSQAIDVLTVLIEDGAEATLKEQSRSGCGRGADR